jgi:hypothetical protein
MGDRLILKLLLLVYLFLGGGENIGNLHESALAYTANTEEEAFQISRQLIPEGGKPGNICGPLSLQILKDGGYISPDIDIKSFWFLRPWEQWVRENVIDTVFPPEEWDYHYFPATLNDIDFNEFPLQEGDFMFFFYGYSCGGTFSHMLVVTKVDGNKAYSVTNYLTDDGWRIGEVLLYNLDNPDVYTFFDRLTDRANTNTIGTTGYCGFSLWRPIRPPIKKSDIICEGHFCPR